ncbi:FimB/Mfa2 family fimbrial subunit [Xylanibacter muris]|uniref:FimB/Mfa2 family fimbrial subunit n=1 Tax=Xylanibacter muris TaxID=2736290 RepID=A0ABX2ANE6_9BACT|nr:FimB/Mfa2 family fimbrial subunit [Xylanibacter muris]NPD92473.1 FimB/Mfa2 family fimbrial subunit [Xylanibacter muris]
MLKFQLKVLVVLLAAFSVLSCSKDVMYDDETVNQPGTSVGPSSGNGVAKLVVRTRTSTEETSDSKVSYPVNIYVFDANERCVAMNVISAGETSLTMELLEGDYTVCAVAGANGDTYSLPSQTEAALTSVVSLADGKQHSDIMTAKNSISLVDGGTHTLTLALQRKVFELQNVKITKVPTNIKTVSVSIAPLYKNVCIDGDYADGAGSYTLELTKGEERTYASSKTVYLMASAGPVTITVNLTNSAGTKSYSYTSSEKFEPNYKLRITGTYTSKVGVTLNGVLEGTAWAGEKDINFSFDENGSTPGTVDPGDNTGGEDVEGDVPAVGTLYKGCYVLKSVSNADKSVSVTLLSPKNITGIVQKGDAETVVEKAVATALSGIATDGIKGWRLPDTDELLLLFSCYSDYNNVISGSSGYDRFIYANFFFYRNAEGVISSRSGSVQNRDVTVDAKTVLRAVTTLTFR